MYARLMTVISLWSSPSSLFSSLSTSVPSEVWTTVFVPAERQDRVRMGLGLGRPTDFLGSGQHWRCGRLLSLSSCCRKNQTRSDKTWVWFVEK